MSCFESFKSELPADEGTTKITFTIRNAGSVEGASTQGQLGGTKVGKCLEQRINHLHFPLNRNNGLVFSLPLQYRVER